MCGGKVFVSALRTRSGEQICRESKRSELINNRRRHKSSKRTPLKPDPSTLSNRSHLGWARTSRWWVSSRNGNLGVLSLWLGVFRLRLLVLGLGWGCSGNLLRLWSRLCVGNGGWARHWCILGLRLLVLRLLVLRFTHWLLVLNRLLGRLWLSRLVLRCFPAVRFGEDEDESNVHYDRAGDREQRLGDNHVISLNRVYQRKADRDDHSSEPTDEECKCSNDQSDRRCLKKKCLVSTRQGGNGEEVMHTMDPPREERDCTSTRTAHANISREASHERISRAAENSAEEFRNLRSRSKLFCLTSTTMLRIMRTKYRMVNSPSIPQWTSLASLWKPDEEERRSNRSASRR